MRAADRNRARREGYTVGARPRTGTEGPMCMENRYRNRTLQRLWDDGCDRGYAEVHHEAVPTAAKRAALRRAAL